jgi:hypothetical protein
VTRGRGANGGGKDNTTGTHSTRSIFPLSNNFQAVHTPGLFPVLAEKAERGKGDGEGNSIQDTKKNKHYKTGSRSIRNRTGSHAASTPPEVASTAQGGSVEPPHIPAFGAETPVVSDYPEIDKVVHELYGIFTRDPGVMVQIQIDRYLFAADAALVSECGGDMHTCVLHESQATKTPLPPICLYDLDLSMAVSCVFSF